MRAKCNPVSGAPNSLSGIFAWRCSSPTDRTSLWSQKETNNSLCLFRTCYASKLAANSFTHFCCGADVSSGSVVDSATAPPAVLKQSYKSKCSKGWFKREWAEAIKLLSDVVYYETTNVSFRSHVDPTVRLRLCRIIDITSTQQKHVFQVGVDGTFSAVRVYYKSAQTRSKCNVTKSLSQIVVYLFRCVAHCSHPSSELFVYKWVCRESCCTALPSAGQKSPYSRFSRTSWCCMKSLSERKSEGENIWSQTDAG